ncbi:hypothetical protein ACN4EG_11075 [Alkalinema pantanalense CENA528]|uniref:hypothetical protein n=1 Tax=Alkalinema pantanalense TaxID=1620705 RepID=UPI003D6FCCAF
MTAQENSESEEDIHYSNKEVIDFQDESPLFGSKVSQSRYSFSQLLEETNLAPEQVKRWIRVINRRKQAIFYGVHPSTAFWTLNTRLNLNAIIFIN